VHWLTLGVSFLGTSLFSACILGLASTELLGIPLAYAVISVILIGLLAGFFVPKFLKSGIKTLPEFFEKRFDKNCRRFLSALYVLSNVAIRMLIILTAARIFLGSIEGIDGFSSLLFFLVVTGVYVMIGGLQAEIRANLVQVFLVALAIAGFVAWMISQGNSPNLAHYRFASQFDFARGSDSGLTRIGLFFGLSIVGFWFWCADQFMVQRVLSARSVSFARKALIAAALLQIIPLLIFVLPGSFAPLSWKAYFDGVLHASFLNSSLPDSVRGGLIIGAVAAFMITVANVLNSTSSLVTFDFFCSLKPGASDRQIVLVGRMTTMLLVLISILMIPLSQALEIGSCIDLFKIFTYLCSMIAAAFIMGLFNRRVGGASVLFCLSAATLVILLRVILQVVFSSQQLGNGLLSWFVQSTFLEFSVFVFLLSLILLIVFDYLRSRYELSLHRARQDPARVGTFLPVLMAIVAVKVFLV
jgi:SSS family solute:Na+ symporter